MVRFALRLDKDKETEWLNEMAEKGYALTRFFAGFYFFEECEPGEYTYQIDFTEKLYNVTDDYREFMQDAGIEIVTCWGWWVILRKKSDEGAFELYTDVESTVEHYKKIRTMFKAVTVLELICFYIEIFGAWNGSKVGFAGMIIIGLFVIALLRIVVKTCQIIGELEARLGKENKFMRRRNWFLTAGMLLNCIVLLCRDVFPFGIFVYRALACVAIVLMVIGLWQMRRY